MDTKPRKSTVLVVDDEPDVLVIVKTMLESSGLNVITAAGARQALGVIEERTNQIALVLSDVCMPYMEGPQLLRKVVEISPSTSVALMSGYAGRDRAGESKFPIITKPFQSTTLVATIQELLTRHKRLTEDTRAHIEKTMRLTQEIDAIAFCTCRKEEGSAVSPDRAIKNQLNSGDVPKVLKNEHETIDEAFENLAGAIRAGATTRELLRLTDIAVNFCETHFAGEEQLFDDYGYPGFPEHRETHKRMLSQVCEIRTAINSGNQEAVDCRTLIDIFHDHVARFDRPAFKWAAGIPVFRPRSTSGPVVAHICRVESATEDLLHPDSEEKLSGCLYCDQPRDIVRELNPVPGSSAQ